MVREEVVPEEMVIVNSGGVTGGYIEDTLVDDSVTTINGIAYDDNSVTRIVPAIDCLRSDCAGSTLLNSLVSYGVSFRYVEGQMNWLYNKSTYTITYCLDVILETQVLHELIHAYQYMVGWSSGQTLNSEIEAFYAMYKYAVHNGKTDLLTGYYDDWDDAFSGYLSNPTPDNYALMAAFVRGFGNGAYNDLTYVESLANTNNVDVLFNCY